MAERIQKLLATAGVASRREVERLIAEGRISVNGQPAVLGQAVDVDDKIRLDGRLLTLTHKAEPTRVLLYKKRVDEVVTRDDPDGRRTVFRKLPALESGRWIAIGRLDINTSGLLLFTNNGELARRLMHPSFQVPRTYAVRVHGNVDDAVLARLRHGVMLDDGPARFEAIVPGENEDGAASNQWYHVTLREGRNRLVRRLIESQDLQVSRLIRIAYGPISLGRGIKSATCREATPAELKALLAVVGMQAESEAAGKPRASGSGKHRPVKPAAVERVSRQRARAHNEQQRPSSKRGRGRGAEAGVEARSGPRSAAKPGTKSPADGSHKPLRKSARATGSVRPSSTRGTSSKAAPGASKPPRSRKPSR
jgi:23S rRNA pseudouridine2605 synthase